MDILKKLLISISILILLFIIFSYAKVEYLTFQHKSEFHSLYKLTNMLDGNLDYLKVMKYSEESASVYYVGEDRSYGVMIDFRRNDNQWELKEWDTIWSNSGSAEGMIWPYYR